jgi:Cys-tRNA synthase (O-phospho-L-seryl-tRNA:Cys-tRNA synthase)
MQEIKKRENEKFFAKNSGKNRSFWYAAMKIAKTSYSDAQSYGNWTPSAKLVLLCRCTDHPLLCGKSRIQGKVEVCLREIQQKSDCFGTWQSKARRLLYTDE